MIRKDSNISIERSGDFEESSFGIDQEDVSLILEIIRNKLYTNKMGSFIREIISNAYDAMVEAKTLKKYPIDITLPTEDNNFTFSIRDYGTGMVEEKVKTIYTKVGKSTRSASNKFVGMMGIGRLVGFCLNDSFNLTCFVDGQKTEYLCYIDETKCGKVAVLSRSDTTEKNGTIISVNISRDLFRTLVDELGSFIHYVDNVAFNIINNPSDGVYNTHRVHDAKSEILLQDDNWKVYKGCGYDGKVYIKMGIVKYQLDLNFDNSVHNIKPFFSNSGRIFVIEMPIGSVDVAASRESLEYTVATKSVLVDKLVKIHKDAIKLIKDTVTKEQTLFEAVKKYQQFEDIWGDLHYNSHNREKEKTILYDNVITGHKVNVTELEHARYGTHQYKFKTIATTQPDPQVSGGHVLVETPVLDANGNPIVLDIEQNTKHSFEIKSFSLRDGKRVKDEDGFTFYFTGTTYYRIVNPSDLYSSPDIKRCRTLMKDYNSRNRVLNLTQRSYDHFVKIIGADILEGAIDFNTVAETKLERTLKEKKPVEIAEYTFTKDLTGSITYTHKDIEEDIEYLENKPGLWASYYYNSICYDFTKENGSADKHDVICALSGLLQLLGKELILYIVPSSIGRILQQEYKDDPQGNDLVPAGIWIKENAKQIEVFTKINEVSISYSSDQNSIENIIKKTFDIKSNNLIPFVDSVKENLKFALTSYQHKSLYRQVTKLYNNGELQVPNDKTSAPESFKDSYSKLVKKYPLLPEEINDVSYIIQFFNKIEHYDDYIYALDQLKG